MIDSITFMTKYKWALLSILLLVAFFTAIYFLFVHSPPQPPMTMEEFREKDFYTTEIQPIFDSRCVACHSCFNSPCQLNLSTYEGIIRGANKISIYDFPKLESRQPTRLFIDAHSVASWRNLNFYPVINENRNTTVSILSTILKDFQGVESGTQAHYDSENSRVCVQNNTEKEWAEYLKTNPAGRMPFGFPGLTKEEVNKLLLWQEKGSLGPSAVDLERRVLSHPDISKLVTIWENLLNQKSMQAQLSSRYIYEHLFLAHLYFQEHPNLAFRLVRSRTVKNEVEELSSLYPFENTAQNFYYRLRPITNTRTHKDHIPYLLSEVKMQNWKQYFYESKWDFVPEKMPSYDRSGGNPFKTFEAIPVKSRYQFLLDDAGYHVMTFIKGPVCRGQTALNVINDNFWVFFLDPDKDPLIRSAGTYKKIAAIMEMPAQIKGDFAPSLDFREKYWEAVKYKYDFFKSQNDLHIDSLWSGELSNTNAALTVYRHFNSATVLRGLQGQMPKTAWVLDYHVFETIYYNLTAGYNVFGPILHQLNSRLFMEISRIASEDLFISLLPEAERLKTRANWNIPTPKKKASLLHKIFEMFRGDENEKMNFDFPYYGKDLILQKNHKNSHQQPQNKEDFLTYLKENFFSKDQVTGHRKEINKDLQRLTTLPWQAIRHFPNTLFIMYKNKEVYTWIHNKDHYNVGMLFFEDERRRPENDSLDLLSGVASSYANYFLILKDQHEVNKLEESLKVATTKDQVIKALKTYGISRHNPNFWSYYDWFTKQTTDPLSHESGLLDLNRYENF